MDLGLLLFGIVSTAVVLVAIQSGLMALGARVGQVDLSDPSTPLVAGFFTWVCRLGVVGPVAACLGGVAQLSLFLLAPLLAVLTFAVNLFAAYQVFDVNRRGALVVTLVADVLGAVIYTVLAVGGLGIAAVVTAWMHA